MGASVRQLDPRRPRGVEGRRRAGRCSCGRTPASGSPARAARARGPAPRPVGDAGPLGRTRRRGIRGTHRPGRPARRGRRPRHAGLRRGRVVRGIDAPAAGNLGAIRARAPASCTSSTPEDTAEALLGDQFVVPRGRAPMTAATLRLPEVARGRVRGPAPSSAASSGPWGPRTCWTRPTRTSWRPCAAPRGLPPAAGARAPRR